MNEEPKLISSAEVNHTRSELPIFFRSTEILSEAHYVLTRLEAIDYYSAPTSLKPFAVRIIEAMAFGLAAAFAVTFLLIVGSPSFSATLSTLYPHFVQYFMLTMPFVIIGIFAFLSYYIYSTRRRREYLRLAQAFKYRIEQLVRELENSNANVE